MTTIIAGRFQTSAQSDRAVEALAAQSVPRDRISVFFVTPPGQHDATPVGGDDHQSAGLERAGSGAATGASVGIGLGVAGALIGATAGLAAPMVAIAGLGAAAAGAYSGALAGAMNSSLDPGQEAIRHAGMMVAVDAGAVDVDEHGEGATPHGIAELLRMSGAVDIESTEGVWADGTWEDFDPTTPPKLLDQAAPLAPSAATE